MLAGSGVLRLLDDNQRILRQLPSDRERGCQRGIARRTTLQTFQFCEQLGREEDLALGDGDVAIEIAQPASRVARNVHSIGVDRKGEAEPGMPGGE